MIIRTSGLADTESESASENTDATVEARLDAVVNTAPFTQSALDEHTYHNSKREKEMYSINQPVWWHMFATQEWTILNEKRISTVRKHTDTCSKRGTDSKTTDTAAWGRLKMSAESTASQARFCGLSQQCMNRFARQTSAAGTPSSKACVFGTASRGAAPAFASSTTASGTPTMSQAACRCSIIIILEHTQVHHESPTLTGAACRIMFSKRSHHAIKQFLLENSDLCDGGERKEDHGAEHLTRKYYGPARAKFRLPHFFILWRVSCVCLGCMGVSH